MKKTTISDLGVSAFCESMAMMLKAGIRTDEAIALLLEEDGEDGVLTTALRQAGKQVEAGTGIARALEDTGAFPGYMVRMIGLGERSGQLEEVFSHLAEYYARQHTMNRQLWSVVRYPAVMLIVILAVLAVMLAKVLPVFSGVYESMTGSLTASSYWYVQVAYGICRVMFALMLALAVLLMSGMLLWRTGKGKRALSRLLERLPVTAGLMGSMGLYRFLSAFQILLAAGEPQDLAAEEAAAMADCRAVEEKLSLCRDRMAQGEGIAQAAYHVGLLEPVYGRMLLAGARSGNMDQVLGRLCALLREDTLGRADALLGILDPVLSGLMIVTVGLALISVMLPLIGMMSSIG